MESKIGNETIKSNTCEKLPGEQIDKKLRLNTHLGSLCKKVSRKIDALATVTPYMTILKRYILMNTFFRLRICYRPLLRMCYITVLNNKINRHYKWCLRII